jgi:hypothetical protein
MTTVGVIHLVLGRAGENGLVASSKWGSQATPSHIGRRRGKSRFEIEEEEDGTREEGGGDNAREEDEGATRRGGEKGGGGVGQGGGREEEGGGRAALTGDEESEQESVGEEGIPALVGNM